MKPQLLTQNGHNMFEMLSLLQKAIRRGHDAYAKASLEQTNDYFSRGLLGLRNT